MTNEIMVENFPEMVQVMYQQIEDSQHIPSRVTKNILNLDAFSQSCDDRTPALGSCGLCSSPGFRTWQRASTGTCGGRSGATAAPSSPESCLRTLPSLMRPVALTMPCTGSGGPASLPSPWPGWVHSVLILRTQASWVRVLPLTLCGPCQAHCPLWT